MILNIRYKKELLTELLLLSKLNPRYALPLPDGTNIVIKSENSREAFLEPDNK